MIPTEIERRIRDADMAPVGSDLADRVWSSAELMERVDAIVAGSDAHRARVQPVGLRSRNLRQGWAIAVGAAAVVLIPVLLAAWLTQSDPGGGDVPPADSAPAEPRSGSVPYASFPNGEVLHDESWAAIVFYRPPNCIPPLIDLIHTPETTAVEDCEPPTVSVTDTGGGVTDHTGLGAVPVWFAPWPLVERLAADGDLTRRELLSMQTHLQGIADVYEERLGPDVSETHSSGELADGTPFSFDGSSGSLSLSLPATLEQATVQSLEGVWENSFNRVEFRRDGSLSIDRTRSLGPAPPAGISGGTFEVDSGFLTIAESELHDCLVESVSPSHYSFTYYALIDIESGRLVLEFVSDDCPKRIAGFLEPYMRAG